jgi:hypothetical protein
MPGDPTPTWGKFCTESPIEHAIAFKSLSTCPLCHQRNPDQNVQTPPLPRVRSTPLIEIPDDTPPGRKAVGIGRTDPQPSFPFIRFSTYNTDPIKAARAGSIARAKSKEQSF